MSNELKSLSNALGTRYRFDRELGRGGMATVHLADDLKHHRQVAIKVLADDVAFALGHERFLQEIDIVARLTHPNILPLLDSGEVEGTLFYVMPYVSADSLRQRLDHEKQLAIDDATRLACEIAGALDFAHRSGVIHRDVKPENILLIDGHAIVADFGIARAMSRAGGDVLTTMGRTIGTPAYMSPEQANADTELDGRSDIYSLGCVLYEMLAGEPPFTGRTAQAVIAKRLTQPAPSVRVLRDAVSERLDRVIRRTLSRSPADRYETADNLRIAIETAVARDRSRQTARTDQTTHEGDRRTSSRQRHAIKSLVVLPFKNIAHDTQQEYFVDGMHDAIICQLAQIAALEVTSRTSAAHYKNSEQTISQIARELKVDAVVEGSVLCAGDSVRIHVDLIQARPRERLLWAQTYDRNIRDVLALHSEVARAVVDEIRVTVTPQEQKRLQRARQVDPEAYRNYLVGNFQLSHTTEAAFGQALKHFSRAIAIDPEYAPAYAGMSIAYIELGSWASTKPPSSVSEQAKEAALTALDKDPTLAEAHIALARARQLFDWSWAEAEAEFRRGIELNPRSSYALMLYANYLMSLGRFEEAEKIGRRSIELDPLTGDAYFQVGWSFDHRRRDAEALEYYEKGMELAPKGLRLGFLLELAQFHGERGRVEEASRYADESAAMITENTPPAWLARLGYGYAVAKRPNDARRILDDLLARAKQQYVPPTCPASLFGMLGDVETGVDFIEEAYEVRDVIMVWLKIRHQFDSLRLHPRFQKIMRRMEFPS